MALNNLQTLTDLIYTALKAPGTVGATSKRFTGFGSPVEGDIDLCEDLAASSSARAFKSIISLGLQKVMHDLLK